MGDNFINGLVTVATAIVGLGIIAVLVSKNAVTSQVISASGSGLASALTAAEGPVSGSQFGSLNAAGTYNGAGFLD